VTKNKRRFAAGIGGLLKDGSAVGKNAPGVLSRKETHKSSSRPAKKKWEEKTNRAAIRSSREGGQKNLGPVGGGSAIVCEHGERKKEGDAQKGQNPNGPGEGKGNREK